MRRILLLFVLVALVPTGCSKTAKRAAKIDAYGLQVESARLGNELNLFTWSDYLDPQLAKEFEQKYGIKLNIDYYDTNEAMLAKLKAGGVGQYDLVIASDYAVEALARDHMLEPLDYAAIPNTRNIDARFRNVPYDPGNTYSIAYQWGTTGLGIRTDLMKPRRKDLDTWRLVFDSTYSVGPIAMLSDERETIGAALMYLGFSPNSTDSTELARAEDLLIRQRSRVLTYAPLANGRDLLASGDVVVAHNSSGDVMLGKADAPGIQYVVPREGAIIWTDNMVIPSQAPHKYAADVFINFILDAHVGARLSDFTNYASPNAAARPFIDAGMLHNSAIYPDSAVLSRLQYLRDLGAARAVYDRLWTRLRAGG